MAMNAITESNMDPKHATRILVQAGDHWLHELHAGQTFRIVDLEGNQAVDTFFLDARDTAERYCAQTTIREQGSIHLTTGTRILSTRGREMLRIVADTCGRHDTLGGACAAESNQVRYGLEKRPMHNCRDSFLLAMARSGRNLTKRDIGANVNFFMNVPVTPDGKLDFQDGISGAGKYVEMIVTRDVLVLISNCPQLNNPCNGWNPTPVELLVWDPWRPSGARHPHVH
ncbi:MAG: DUF1989 domain-containing protein [Fibrobacteres bacterium]|nr:DUF1989 domain-containing protein [Fibrobacterota bacterium]